MKLFLANGFAKKLHVLIYRILAMNMTYKLDGLGRRYSRSVNGVVTQYFIYDEDNRLIAELDPSGVIDKHFVYTSKGHAPDLMIKSGVSYRMITDNLGSVRFVVNSVTGQVMQKMQYDEFGKVLVDTNPGYQPFGYAGGIYDKDTALTLFGVRSYDASVGRWLSKDPILFAGGDVNLYGYTWNDPINLIDPWGLEGISPDEGKKIADAAKTWAGTPYKLGGNKKGLNGGVDCSHATNGAYGEAGFPYGYSPTSTFASNPNFFLVNGPPQVGDVALFDGHMAIYDPNAGPGMNIWTARRTGGPAFGPGKSSWFGSPKWYRYNSPTIINDVNK